jgi:tRNA (Thr-GGU) A37 N-methylase
MTFEITPIGRVHGGRDAPVDDDWGRSRARIELDGVRYTADALAGLAEFSHLEVIFLFDRVSEAQIEYGARRPRGRADWPLVGIFANGARTGRTAWACVPAASSPSTALRSRSRAWTPSTARR